MILWLLTFIGLPVLAIGVMVGAAYREKKISSGDERLEKVIKMIEDYGYIDGQHHKQWLLDQIAQILLADGYENWKADNWDKGVAP